MVLEELVEGLKMALQKGQSLKSAMMSFFNAGYTKEEIEEAARVMSVSGIPSAVSGNNSAPSPPAGKNFQKLPPSNDSSVPTPPYSPPGTPVSSVPGQKISNYGTVPKPKPRFIIFFLIALLIFFVGALIALFLFKDELIAFFAGLSG